MRKILSIKVENSSFFINPFEIQFGDKLNCVMGGRGTGKSTLLHFIKSAIDESAEESRNTYNVLRSNLGQGLITIHLQDETGKKYRIEKSLEESPQTYAMPGNHFIELEKVLNELDCDIYEAQAIEEIGKNSLDRLQLVDKMISSQRGVLYNEFENIQMQLAENYQQIKSENMRASQLLNILRGYEGAKEELAKWMEEKPEDLKKNEEAEFEDADKNEKMRAAEKRYVKGTQKKLGDLETCLTEFVETFQGLQESAKSSDQFLNKKEIQMIQAEVSSLSQAFSDLVKTGHNKIQNVLDKIEVMFGQLSTKHAAQQNEFSQLKLKFEKHKVFYTKWNALSKRIDEQGAVKKELEQVENKCRKIRVARKKLVASLNEKKKELFNLRKGCVEQLNKQFEGSIKVTLSFSGITEEYEQNLKNALKGSNMRYNVLIPAIVQNFNPDRFAEIVHERDADTLKKLAGIDKERSESIFNALYETDAIYSIEAMYCPDLPDFLLKIDGKNEPSNKGKDLYKKSDELSTGQRCTTVLPVVFAVSNNPLIIDQPEDNLDNKYISETIHGIIRDQKERRQLIFITHNPNIPVLSDSETNFFLSYEEKFSRLDAQGDVDGVKTNILTLLEGGRAAFDKREKLYNA